MVTAHAASDARVRAASPARWIGWFSVSVQEDTGHAHAHSLAREMINFFHTNIPEAIEGWNGSLPVAAVKIGVRAAAALRYLALCTAHSVGWRGATWDGRSR